METAERELEETRVRAAALEKALADTRTAYEEREREVDVAIKDYKCVFFPRCYHEVHILCILHYTCTMRRGIRCRQESGGEHDSEERR